MTYAKKLMGSQLQSTAENCNIKVMKKNHK